MSTESTVSMRELELESAELLPARETLNCYSHRSSGGFSYTNVSQNSAGFVNFLNGNNVSISILSL